MIPWIYVLIIMIVSSVMLLSLALYSWFSGFLVGRKVFSLMMLAVAIYTVTYAFELISPDYRGKIFWNNLSFIGSTFIGCSWLALSVIYSGNIRFLNKWTVILLVIIPLASVFLKFTDSYFHLIYKTTWIDRENPYPVILFTRSTWFWVQTVYTNLCVLAGNIVVITVYFQASKIFRRQAGILLLASFIPWAGYIIFQFDIFQRGLDFVLILLAVVGPLYAVGLRRYRLFDIFPVKWKTLLETITNYMIILDNDNRIADYNPGIRKLFRKLNSGSIGMEFDKIAEGLPEILKLTSSPDRSQSEWRIETETGFRLLRTQVFFIRDHQGNITGKTLVINETFVKSVKYYSGRQDLLNDLEKIENIMDKEKPYLDPEFTLQDLADMADIPRNRLSWILNKQKKQSFYDFLNLYRINEAKRLMITGEFSNILKIAYNSGFKSKSTFYSSFKRITTKTPSEYLSGLKKI